MGDFEIQYAAHTAVCTFLLDADGICRRIQMNPGAGQRARDAARAASRCVGAQYVASLDGSLPGLLSEMPKVGIAMLFARTDERGRISLVRTGHVTRFEHFDSRIEDPFAVPDERPSVSVATSAPPLTPSRAPTPRTRQQILPPPDPYADGERIDDRTKPIQAFRNFELRAVDPAHGPTSEPPTLRTPLPPPPRMQGVQGREPLRNSDVVPKPDAITVPFPAKPAIRRRG